MAATEERIMAVKTRLTLKDLTTAAKRLSAEELLEFTRSLAAWQGKNGWPVDEDAALVQMTKVRLPSTDEQQLWRLIAKSERGTLTAEELSSYRNLARQAQQLDVARLVALAELVRRWGKPLAVVKEEIGWQGTADGA
jgi:hypothetical protein